VCFQFPHQVPSIVIIYPDVPLMVSYNELMVLMDQSKHSDLVRLLRVYQVDINLFGLTIINIYEPDIVSCANYKLIKIPIEFCFYRKDMLVVCVFIHLVCIKLQKIHSAANKRYFPDIIHVELFSDEGFARQPDGLAALERPDIPRLDRPVVVCRNDHRRVLDTLYSSNNMQMPN
jgi:hypothetical protein